MRRVSSLILLIGLAAPALSPGRVHSSPLPIPPATSLTTPTAAVPTPKPVLVCGSGSRTGCGPPPCNYQEKAPALHPGAPRFYRTRQGVAIRLQPIPTTYPATSLNVYGDMVAWGVPAYSDPGARFSHPPRLYLASLSDFHPVLISQDNACGAGFDDVRLSANWLVWMQHVPPNAGKGPQLNRIWALNLHTGRRFAVNYFSNPTQGVGDLDPLSLDGDTVTWARTTIHGAPHWATFSIMSRRLSNWAMTYPVSATIRLVNGRFPTYPSVQGESQPQFAGHLLTWVRERWNGSASVNDVMLKDLGSGRTRELWPNDGSSPTTNGSKVAWVVQTGGSPGLTLLRYDPRTGSRAVLSTALDNLIPSAPTISADLLVWRTRSPTRTGVSIYRVVARDLHTGREYGLASGSDFYAGTGIPFTTVTGPGRGWANRVIWQQTVYNRQGRGQGYLAVGDVP